MKKELLLPHITDKFMQDDITQLRKANPVLKFQKRNGTNISFLVKDELDNIVKQTISKNSRGRPFGSLNKLVDLKPQPQTAGFYSHESNQNINENLEKYNDTNVNYTYKNLSRKSNNLTRKNTRNRVNGNNKEF